ncbi:hypothetical protein KXD96_17345 [Mycobacterium sp. SMC-2]|nr:hypothetical protein KXD96_17345 [Mycobacterium sp. SMC-2]
MAVVTRHARIGCLVPGVTYRNAAILANMAVTVHHISGGRLSEACAAVGRGADEIERSAQVSLYPAEAGQVDEQLALLPQFEQLGCEHMVLAFREPWHSSNAAGRSTTRPGSSRRACRRDTTPARGRRHRTPPPPG